MPSRETDVVASSEEVFRLEADLQKLISSFLVVARDLSHKAAVEFESLHESALEVYVNLLKQLSEALAHAWALSESLSKETVDKAKAAETVLRALVQFSKTEVPSQSKVSSGWSKVQEEIRQLNADWVAEEQTEDRLHRLVLSSADQSLRIVNLIFHGLEETSYERKLGDNFNKLKTLVNAFKNKDFSLLADKENNARSLFKAKLQRFLRDLQDDLMARRGDSLALAA